MEKLKRFTLQVKPKEVSSGYIKTSKISKPGSLPRIEAIASRDLALLVTFARDIGLVKQLDRSFSHLQLQQRGCSVPSWVMSFRQMIIKGWEEWIVAREQGDRKA
jgi:hypothetical protein